MRHPHPGVQGFGRFQVHDSTCPCRMTAILPPPCAIHWMGMSTRPFRMTAILLPPFAIHWMGMSMMLHPLMSKLHETSRMITNSVALLAPIYLHRIRRGRRGHRGHRTRSMEEHNSTMVEADNRALSLRRCYRSVPGRGIRTAL